jgi:hypothetical protein
MLQSRNRSEAATTEKLVHNPPEGISGYYDRQTCAQLPGSSGWFTKAIPAVASYRGSRPDTHQRYTRFPV